MRRFRQALSTEENIAILQKCNAGTLALADQDNNPYIIPLNYVYYQDKIYFHCAKAGQKLDIITKNPKASFCIIEKDDIIPEEFTSYYRSTIIKGNISFVDDEQVKYDVLMAYVKKYSSKFIKEGIEEIQKFIKHTCILELSIDELTGKEALDLVKQNK